MEAGAKPDDGDAASAQPPGGGSQADTSHVDDIMSGKYDEAEAEGDDPGEDIRKMHQALANERCAPDILPYYTELVQDLMAQVANQKETVEAMIEEGKEFHAVAYEMEIERVQYMLNSYHRCRLQKLDKYKLHYISQGEISNIISEAESRLLKTLVDDWGEHIGNEVTNMLPAQFSELTDVRPDYGVDMVPRPPEHDHVFFKATSFLGQIQIGKMVDPLDVNEGDVLCVPFSSIRRYLAPNAALEGVEEGGTLL